MISEAVQMGVALCTTPTGSTSLISTSPGAAGAVEKSFRFRKYHNLTLVKNNYPGQGGLLKKALLISRLQFSSVESRSK